MIFELFSSLEKDHFFLWIPVLLGVGIAVYFGMTIELPIGVPLTCLFISGVTTYYLRNYYIVFLSTLALSIVFVGFSSAQLRTVIMNTNMLPQSFGPAVIQGRIAAITPTTDATKIILKDLQITRLRADWVPTSLRLHVNGENNALKTGDWIETRAMLKPTPQPASPQAFDFQRHAYFQGIGAIAFSYGAIKIISEPQQKSMMGYIQDLRQDIRHRIEAVFPKKEQQDIRALAVAFLTGHKQVIVNETHEIVRAAGLAHLLAISGLHIGLVSALTFFTIRLFLACIPAIALRYPIKKWAAVCAIFSALLFTLLTGASIPTVRAFIMTSIVLIGVLFDRKAISLRTVAWAAICILLVNPESVLGASFQLSFAAVTALVVFYERRVKDFNANKISSYIKGIFTSSLIASLATTPFAAYHFNRIALYGILSNLLAIPLTVFWIMPLGIASLMLMPFGWETIALIPMGWGIDILLLIANYTANLPFAQISVPTISVSAFLPMIFGGLLLVLLRSKLRLAGPAFIATGLVLTLMGKQPDVLISQNGKLTAIKDNRGHILVSNLRYASYVRDNWIRGWGKENESPVSFEEAIPCDVLGCRYLHPSGQQIILNQQQLALPEDCQKADILITPLDSPSACTHPKRIIDAHDMMTKGAHALYLTDHQIKIITLKDVRGTRPWTVYGQ